MITDFFFLWNLPKLFSLGCNRLRRLQYFLLALLQQSLEETAIEHDWGEMTHVHWCKIEVGLKFQMN